MNFLDSAGFCNGIVTCNWDVSWQKVTSIGKDCTWTKWTNILNSSIAWTRYIELNTPLLIHILFNTSKISEENRWKTTNRLRNTQIFRNHSNMDFTCLTTHKKMIQGFKNYSGRGTARVRNLKCPINRK